jgi:Capsular polysaccharide biosynthesis protein
MELELKDIGKLLKKSWIIILVFVIISTGIGAALSIYVLQKQYSATAMIMVSSTNTPAAAQNGQAQNNMTMNEYDLNVKLVDSYTVLCKSERILNQVIQKLNLNLTPKKLADLIKVNSEMNTDIISISVTNPSPQQSMDITNTLVDVFKQEVTNIMKMDNVQVIDYATLPDEPASPNVQVNTAAAFLIGLIISIIIAFVRYHYDNTIINEDQITERLKFPVIGSVPKIAV